MKIPRLPAPGWPPVAATPPRPATATPPTSVPAAEGAGLRALDTAAGLRILVEEVRLAVVEQLGNLKSGLPPAGDDGPADAVARLLAFLRAASGQAGDRNPAAVAGDLQRAVTLGVERALAAVAARAGTLPGVAIAIDDVGGRVVAVLAASAPPLDAATRAARAYVAEVRQALQERLGMLPRLPATTADGDGPAEALAGVARLMRAAATDPVLGVRTSPFALGSVLELGAVRAIAALAGDPDGAAATRAVVDLQVLSTRALAPSVAGRMPAPAVRDVPAALRALVGEVHLALPGRSTLAPTATTEAPLDPSRAALAMVRALAEAAVRLPAGDPRATRAAAESTLDLALRRALLPLTSAAGRPAFATALADARVEAGQWLLAAEAAASRSGLAGGWSRPALEAALALARGQEPPFRFDLVGTSRPRPARRRQAQGNPDGVDAIESTDPEEAEDPPSLEWPRLPP